MTPAGRKPRGTRIGARWSDCALRCAALVFGLLLLDGTARAAGPADGRTPPVTGVAARAVQQLPATQGSNPSSSPMAGSPITQHAASGPVPSAADGQLIDLPMALRLAEVANPRLGLSREAIREALALYQGTRLLLVPDLNAGTNYHLHNGALLTSSGIVRQLDEQSIYVGGGARALAAETVGIPMVRIFAHVGEAWYLPLAARQDMAARSSEANATETLVLFDVATRYLDLAGAEERVEAWRQSHAEALEIERTTRAFAQTGQGRDGDFKRARAQAMLLLVDLQGAEAEARVASNQLARLLRLDPSIRLTTIKAPLEIVVLVDPQTSVEALVDLGYRRRWELAAQSAQIAAADERLRLERTRPLYPTLAVGFSAGGFGGGSNQTSLGVPSLFQTFSGRDDFDVMAVWTLQNMGVGNVAATRQRRIDRDTLTSRRALTAAQVRREVVAAHAEAVAARRRIVAADMQLEAAERGAREELIRTRAGEGLPIEALNSINLLAEARQDAIGAVVDFNVAEFRLFAALGEIPNSRTPDPLTPGNPAEPVAAPPQAPEDLPKP